MPASYLNLSSPIKRETNTYVDQDGVKFSSMLITATAASAAALVPAIGSTYELDSNLWVVQSDLTYSADGLGKITVTASGASANAKPRVRIIPGGPKIFGLKPLPGFQGTIPNHHPTSGVSIEVVLISSEQDLTTTLQSYTRALLPSSINGLALPEPAQGPCSLDLPPVFDPDTGAVVSNVLGQYFGFICTSIRTDPRGRAVVVTLQFQESGFLNTRLSNGSFSNVFSYNL